MKSFVLGLFLLSGCTTLNPDTGEREIDWLPTVGFAIILSAGGAFMLSEYDRHDHRSTPPPSKPPCKDDKHGKGHGHCK